LGRSRGGFSTKLHLITDARGTPMAATLTAGQTHESTQAEPLIDAIVVKQSYGRPRRRPIALAADKAYDLPRVRRAVKRRGIQPVIPEKYKPHGRKPGRPPKFDADTYRRRNAIERCVGWIKNLRRIATRYEKLAVNYLAMVQLAFVQQYLKLLFSDGT